MRAFADSVTVRPAPPAPTVAPARAPTSPRGNLVYVRFQEELEVFMAPSVTREAISELVLLCGASADTLAVAHLRAALSSTLSRVLTGRCPVDVAHDIRRRTEEFLAELSIMGIR
jgi:hypothetical protein